MVKVVKYKAGEVFKAVCTGDRSIYVMGVVIGEEKVWWKLYDGKSGGFDLIFVRYDGTVDTWKLFNTEKHGISYYPVLIGDQKGWIPVHEMEKLPKSSKEDGDIHYCKEKSW